MSLDLRRRKYMFVAKPYKGPREKGVIIVTFSAGFNAFFRHYDVAALVKGGLAVSRAPPSPGYHGCADAQQAAARPLRSAEGRAGV